MKPRAAKHNQSADQDELHVDSEPYVETPRTAPHRARGAAVPTSPLATLALAGGVGAACLGALLALGPALSPDLSGLAETCAKFGVQAGALVLGGAVLATLGALRRGQLALRTPTTEELEDRLLIEQLTKDSLRSAEALERLEEALVRLENQVQESSRGVEERVVQAAREVVAAIPPPVPPSSPDEAIFRMAASLDQVGMRIEQRLKAQYTALQDHIEDVGAAILSARNQMQGLAKHGEDHAESLRQEVQTQVERVLEETGFWSGTAPVETSTPLGVLDTIDDGSEAAPLDLGLVQSALPIDPEEAREHGIAAGRLDDPLTMDVDTKTRLVQLSSLLADPKLRRALEGIGRNGEQP